MTETTGSTGRPQGFQQVWDAMRRTGVRRPVDDRWLGGVCSGTARRLGIDPVLARVLLVALTLLGGVGLFAYAVALVLLPDHDGSIELERASYGDLTGTTVGAVALLLLAVVVPGPWDLLTGGPVVDGRELVGGLVLGTLLLVGLALLPKAREAAERSAGRPPAGTGWTSGPSPATTSGAGSGSTAYVPPGAATRPPPGYGGAYAPPAPGGTPPSYGPPSPGGPPTYGRPGYGPPPPSRPPRPPQPQRKGPGPAVSAAATGTALLAAGAAWLAADQGLVDGRATVVAAVAALTVLGVVLLVLGLAGRRDGGVGGTAFLALVLTAVVLLVPSWRTTQLAGDASWSPAGGATTVAASAARGGSLGLGDGTLDLSGLADLPEGAAVEVPVRVGIGELEVLVPEGMDVTVRASMLVGTTVVDDGVRPVEDHPGIAATSTLLRAEHPQVVVDARVLVGSVRVVEVEAP